MAELSKAEAALQKRAGEMSQKIMKNTNITDAEKLESLDTIKKVVAKKIKEMYEANKVTAADTLKELDKANDPEIDILNDAINAKENTKIITEPDIELLMQEMNPSLKQKLGGMLPDLSTVKSMEAAKQQTQPNQVQPASSQDATKKAAVENSQ